MRHVSEWCIVIIVATLTAAILWFDLYLGRTDYEIKAEREPIDVSWLWGE